MFYRMILPDWAIEKLANKEPNPKFKKSIKGYKTVEGCLSPEEVTRLNKLGYNAFWFPNHPSNDVYKTGTRYLSGKLIDTFNFVFVDMDLKDGIYKSEEEFLAKLKQFNIAPTLTVKSGHGVHAYWRINDLTREEYLITQFALLRYFKTDDSVWTVLQLMRVPGSLNTKEIDNYRVAEIEDSLSSGQSYNMIDIPRDIYALLTDNDQIKIKNHVNKLDGNLEIQLSDEVNIDELPDAFIDLMSEQENIYQLFNNPTEYYGDRSGADMKLCNILFNKNISKKDALLTLSNTQKALSKGAYRLNYAQSTVDKVYVDRTVNKFKTVGEKIRAGGSLIKRELVKGPYYFDCLIKGWSKKQVLGLVGGAGIGKTSVVLTIFKYMIENNFELNDDIFIFFSLEMPEEEITERWVDLVGKDSPLADRLYVIGNETDEGDPRNIGLQEIYEYCMDIKKSTGKEIGSITIDHIGIMSLHIDTKRKHKFGVDSEQGTGRGNIRTVTINHAATQFKALAKMLNTFIIPLTQTTKEKGVGYTPLGKDAAYGISQYENIVDYMLTLWQPLQLVQEQVDIRFLAWQYAKIRSQHKDDPIKPNSYKLLVYHMDTGDIKPPTPEDYKVFTEWLPQAQELIKLKDKKVETNYSRSITPEVLADIDLKLKMMREGKSDNEK